MLQRSTLAGLDDLSCHIVVVTRLIPDARGTTCNQRQERIMGCQHARILRVPFRTAQGSMCVFGGDYGWGGVGWGVFVLYT